MKSKKSAKKTAKRAVAVPKKRAGSMKSTAPRKVRMPLPTLVWLRFPSVPEIEVLGRGAPSFADLSPGEQAEVLSRAEVFLKRKDAKKGATAEDVVLGPFPLSERKRHT